MVSGETAGHLIIQVASHVTAVCIIQVASGVIAGYLYHPGGQWCDCWLSLSPRWSVVRLLAIFIIQVVSGVNAGHLYHPGGL